jgi:HAD superfamily hydrolase (TIGR01509 family)
MTRPIAPAALLFDLDGTLTETDELHHRAFNELLSGFGRSMDRDTYQSRVMGFPNAEIMAWLFPEIPVAAHAALSDRKEAVFRASVGQLAPAAGLLDLLAWADAQSIPCGVVTNAVRDNAAMMLTGLVMTERFRTIVIGEDLPHGKPHPLPYITGIERLGADAARTVAFEDSRSGVRSAAAAGIACIGLTTALPAEELVAAGARFAVRDFTDPRLRRFVETVCLGPAADVSD